MEAWKARAGRYRRSLTAAHANAEANLKAMFAAALGDQAELTVVFREA